MKKQIELHLDKTSDFFLEMKKELSVGKDSSIQFYMDSEHQKIMAAIASAFKDLAADQGFKNCYEVKLNVDDLNDFKLLIEEKIDQAFNHRFHTTTLERFADFVEGFIESQVEKQINAKKIIVPELVDTDKEKELIKKYIENNWNGFDKVDSKDFFDKVWTVVLEKTKNQFNDYMLLDLIEKWSEERGDYSLWKDAGLQMEEKEFRANLIWEDKVYNFPKDLLMKGMKLKRLINEFHYADIVPGIIAEIKKEFPESSKLKPKGWNDLLKNYEEYVGMEKFDSKNAKKEFGGFSSETAGAPSFEVRISLPHTLYNHKEQGYGPLETLIGSMYGHAYVLSEHNNGAKMLQEFLSMKEKYDDPKYFKEIVKELNFDFKEPLSKALFVMATKEEDENKIKQILGISKREVKNKRKLS